MRGGVIPGAGDSLWVLAARSGIGKTTVAIAAAMGLAFNGAPVLFLSCELTRRAIGARLLAHYCRRAIQMDTPLFSSNDLEGRGKVITGVDRELLESYTEAFAKCTSPDGRPMAPVLYQSRFAATIEEICALVEDSKSAHPSLSVLVLDHFHAMGTSGGYGSNTTAELAARAMALKALAGRCELDILVVAQLNRGAYGSTTGPDVSHLAGTSELGVTPPPSGSWSGPSRPMAPRQPRAPWSCTTANSATASSAMPISPGPCCASIGPIASLRLMRPAWPSQAPTSTPE
jgi:hypothetical protein